MFNNPCMCNPFMNFYMPVNFISYNNFGALNFFSPLNYFQMFQMPASNSIWQQAEYNIPKLEDSLVISEGNKKESINVNTRVSVQQKSVKRKERSKTVSAETNVQEAKNTKAAEDKIIIKGVEYNKKNGEKLAQRVLDGLPANRTEPLCAKYVKEAIRDVGLGPYIQGDGYYCQYILRANPNFEEIKVKGNELSSLPAGCIIVYDKGDGGYSTDSGHVEITLGDGRACSDIITNNIEQSDNTHVFVPV